MIKDGSSLLNIDKPLSPLRKRFFTKGLLLVCFLGLMPCLYGGSILLVNDTAYVLRAVVRGNDGTYLGEMVLNPEHSNRWTDTYGQVGMFGKGTIYREQSTRSHTPYTVRWHCMNGDDFSFCQHVATGSQITARSCFGRRICSPPKKGKGPYPNEPESHLYPREEE